MRAHARAHASARASVRERTRERTPFSPPFSLFLSHATFSSLPRSPAPLCAADIFFDRQQVESGSCALGDVACYVIARVLSRYPGRNGGEFLIDAGGLAMHKDPAGLRDGTWGCLLDEPGLVLKKLTQEVAVVGRLDGAPVDLGRFAPGAVVRVLPNHSCMTAAMHDVFHVVEGAPRDAAGSRVVVAQWAPVKFWGSREPR